VARKGTPCGVPSPQAAPPATTGPRVVAVACEWVRGIPVTSAAGPKKAARPGQRGAKLSPLSGERDTPVKEKQMHSGEPRDRRERRKE